MINSSELIVQPDYLVFLFLICFEYLIGNEKQQNAPAGIKNNAADDQRMFKFLKFGGRIEKEYCVGSQRP